MPRVADLSAPFESDAQLLPIPNNETCGENLRRDIEKAGLQRVVTSGDEQYRGKATFHSLRVTFINTVLEKGANVKTVMALARHKTATMTFNRYAKANRSKMQAVPESISEDFCGTDVA